MKGVSKSGIIEGMKVLLYLEGKSVLQKSGIGRALQHQMHALDLAGIPYTTDILGDYDVVHINTYGPRSLLLLHAAKRRGKKVIMHGHSTREDFQNSFIGSNLFAPLFGKYLAHMYKKADFIITPSEYSKQLIQSYGVKTPIVAVSNGIDLSKYKKDPKKEEVFRKHFKIQEGQKVVLCAGLYFRRKGIEDLRMLIDKGCDVNWINCQGKTALMLTLERIEPDIANFLLDNGAVLYKSSENQIN